MKAGSEKRANKYARGLIEAVAPADFRNVADELAVVAEVFAENTEIRRLALDLLSNPAVALAQKHEIILGAVGSTFHPMIINVLKLLIERGLVGLVGQISTHFNRLVDEFDKLSQLHVVSAKPLEAQEQSKFIEQVKSSIGSNGALLQFTFATDPGLLGGMQIRCGDKLLDSSLRGAVDRIFTELGKAA